MSISEFMFTLAMLLLCIACIVWIIKQIVLCVIEIYIICRNMERE